MFRERKFLHRQSDHSCCLLYLSRKVQVVCFSLSRCIATRFVCAEADDSSRSVCFSPDRFPVHLNSQCACVDLEQVP